MGSCRRVHAGGPRAAEPAPDLIMQRLPIHPICTVTLLSLLVGGCAFTARTAGERVAYVCDEGKNFVMHYSPARDAARIEIDRMDFNLVAESREPGRETFGCGMLTVEESDGTRQVLTEGVATHQNCRPVTPRNTP